MPRTATCGAALITAWTAGLALCGAATAQPGAGPLNAPLDHELSDVLAAIAADPELKPQLQPIEVARRPAAMSEQTARRHRHKACQRLVREAGEAEPTWRDEFTYDAQGRLRLHAVYVGDFPERATLTLHTAAPDAVFRRFMEVFDPEGRRDGAHPDYASRDFSTWTLNGAAEEADVGLIFALFKSYEVEGLTQLRVVDQRTGRVVLEVDEMASLRHTYDARGRLRATDYFGLNEHFDRSARYRYNARGQLVHEERFNHAIVRRYNRSGDLIEASMFHRTLQGTRVGRDGKASRLPRVRSAVHADRLQWRKAWRYDRDGRLLESREILRERGPAADAGALQLDRPWVCRFTYGAPEALQWTRSRCGYADGGDDFEEVRVALDDAGRIASRVVLATRQAPAARREVFRYDARGLLIEHVQQEGSLQGGEPSFTKTTRSAYVYDAHGRLVYKVAGAARWAWEYDALGRPARVALNRAALSVASSPSHAEVRWSYGCWEEGAPRAAARPSMEAGGR